MRRSRLKIFLLYFAPQFSVYTKFGIDPLSWLTTICYGFYCLSLIFNTLLEDVSENVDAMNESNLPLYILFFVIAMHSISITLIYRVLRPAE